MNVKDHRVATIGHLFLEISVKDAKFIRIFCHYRLTAGRQSA